MDNDRSATVHYFVKTVGMDVTKFDEVILTHNFTFISLTYSLLGGVAYHNIGWVGLL